MATQTAGDVAVLPTFEVDRDGLKKVLARKGMGWILPELLQNAWDEDSTNVTVVFKRGEKCGTNDEGETLYHVDMEIVDDDPEGFTDLAHAYTLFAESEKKGDSEKRGRFNVGEKLVVAAAEWLTVYTTTGTVHFDSDGRRMTGEQRDHGTKIEALFKMTRQEYDEAMRIVWLMLPPKNVTTTINDVELDYREPVREFSETLRTPVGAELKIRDRKATIKLYEPREGETPHLYEMGIPVVPLLEGGDRWHVDIGQKVPLNIERDNVTPSYLRRVRAIVLDHAHDLLTSDDATAEWATDAIMDDRVGPEGLATLLTLRFGDKAVVYDPSDHEANKIAASQGYTVVHGGTLPKEAWNNVKTHGILAPAGQVTPSPKPYEPGQQNTRTTEDPEKWTAGMVRMANFVKTASKRLTGADVVVEFVNDPACMNFSATYTRSDMEHGRMEFNLRTLGRAWFDKIGEPQVSLFIHELGHHYESDHLSTGYYRALTNLGARLTLIVAQDPEWWALAINDES